MARNNQKIPISWGLEIGEIQRKNVSTKQNKKKNHQNLRKKIFIFLTTVIFSVFLELRRKGS